MAIRSETLRLIRSLRAAVGGEADAGTRALTAAWIRAWDELATTWAVAAGDIAALAVELTRWPQPWELARIARLQAALVATEQALAALAEQVTTTATTAATAAITATLAAEPPVIASQLPAALRAAAAQAFASRIPDATIPVMIARTTQQITAVTRPLSQEATEALRRALIQGVTVGANPRTTARALIRRVEGAFNGGLTRAMVITRTETLDAYRGASRQVHEANRDVLDGWVWLARLDTRCCPSCWAQHGQIHPVTDPGPLDHQQGRCARVPHVRPWRELGISLNEPADDIPDARATFDALPEDQQLAIMGPGRLAALQSGRARWADLSILRRTPGWRDSYGVRPVQQLAA